MTPTNHFPPTRPVEYGVRRRTVVALADSRADMPLPSFDAISEIFVMEDVCPPGGHYEPGPMRGLTLILTLHGRTQTTVADKTYLHQPGSLLTIAPAFPIIEQVGSDTHWHNLGIMLVGGWVEQMRQRLVSLSRPVIDCASVSAQRRQAFLTIGELVFAQPPGWQWRCLGLTADLFADLHLDATRSSPGDELLNRVGQIIDREPQERYTVAQLAGLVGLTPRQLIYEFRKAAGKPLAHWILERRIATARQLLSQGRSVWETSDDLGFANPYHFSRAFKAVSGVPPSVVVENALRAGLPVRKAELDRTGRQ